MFFFFWGKKKIPLCFRTRLVCCNGYYTVIGISITKNKRSSNVINITIHLFGDNKTLNMYFIFYYNMINIRVLLIIQVLIILKKI